MKKICLLLIMLLITSLFSGCIGQEKNSEVNNTTPSYNSTQNRHPSFWSMLFWSTLWNRHVTPSIQTAKSYIAPKTGTKTDASDPLKKVDAKDPIDAANRNSVNPDTANKPKPKVKITTARIKRSGRR